MSGFGSGSGYGCGGAPWAAQIHAGFNQLRTGYLGYGSSYWVGADGYYAQRTLSSGEEGSPCRSNVLFRFSFGYAPLDPPASSTQYNPEISALYGTVIYQHLAIHPEWIPFIGLGAGAYKGPESKGGINFAAGVIGPPVIESIRIVPEVRIHWIGGFGGSNSNLVYQLGLYYRPGSEPPRRKREQPRYYRDPPPPPAPPPPAEPSAVEAAPPEPAVADDLSGLEISPEPPAPAAAAPAPVAPPPAPPAAPVVTPPRVPAPTRAAPSPPPEPRPAPPAPAPVPAPPPPPPPAPAPVQARPKQPKKPAAPRKKAQSDEDEEDLQKALDKLLEGGP